MRSLHLAFTDQFNLQRPYVYDMRLDDADCDADWITQAVAFSGFLKVSDRLERRRVEGSSQDVGCLQLCCPTVTYIESLMQGNSDGGVELPQDTVNHRRASTTGLWVMPALRNQLSSYRKMSKPVFESKCSVTK